MKLKPQCEKFDTTMSKRYGISNWVKAKEIACGSYFSC